MAKRKTNAQKKTVGKTMPKKSTVKGRAYSVKRAPSKKPTAKTPVKKKARNPKASRKLYVLVPVNIK